MSSRIKKITMVLLGLLAAVTVIFAVMFYFGRVVKGTEGTNYEEPVVTNAFIIFAYILLGVTVIITLIFSVRSLILNPKGLKMALISLGVGVILVLLASLFADNTVLDLPHYKGGDNVPRTLFWTDTGLYAAYFLAIIAVAAIIVSEIKRLIRK